jgi:hypothetical protein
VLLLSRVAGAAIVPPVAFFLFFFSLFFFFFFFFFSHLFFFQNMPTTVATAALVRPGADSFDSPMNQEERTFMAHLKLFNADKGKSLNVRSFKKMFFVRHWQRASQAV